MTYFYLLFIPVSIALVFEARWLWLMRRHDRVIFGFRRLRSDVTRFLMASADELSREDYLFARQVLTAIDSAERQHACNRIRFFNYRAYVQFLRGFTVSAEQVAAMPRTTRPELLRFEQRFGACLFRGFVAYTPLFASELIAKLMMILALVSVRFCARLGFRAASRAAVVVRSALHVFERQSDEFHSSSLRYA